MFSFETINVAVPDLKMFLAAFVADVTAVNLNGIETCLANGLSKFLIKGKPVFSNGLRHLPRNPPDFTILGS